MSDAPASHDAHAEFHPGWSTYWKVALVLTAVTVAEVWFYYIPSFVASPYFVPILLLLSAFKFAVVVAFYMHLKYDNKLYRALFVGPFSIAVIALLGLMFLFGKLAIRTSLLTK